MTVYFGLFVPNSIQGVTGVDLLGRIEVVPKGWTTTPQEGYVTETLRLRIYGTDTEIITAVNSLDDLCSIADEYRLDPVNYRAVWLKAQANTESLKQALVMSMALIPDNTEEGSMTQLLGKGGMFYTLVIDRHPTWEDHSISLEQGYLLNNLSALGGKSTIADTGTVRRGSAPGRIGRLEIAFDSGSGPPTGDAIEKVWVGIRPPYTTNAVQINPKMELEIGSIYNGAALAADANASPGGAGNTVVRVTTITSTSTRYSSISLSQHSPTYRNEYIGKWLVLLRCKVNSGTIGIRMKWGSVTANLSQLTPGELIYASNTAYRMVELGALQFPPAGRQAGTDLNSQTIELWIEQVSGSTTQIDLDCLILTPAFHMAKCIGASGSWAGGAARNIRFEVSENEEALCYQLESGVYVSALEAQFINFEYPMSNNPIISGNADLVVVTAERVSGQVITDLVDVAISLRPRWQNLMDL